MPRLVFLLLLLLEAGCKSRPKEVWSYQTGASIFSSPAIVNESLVIGSTDSYLYCLSLKDGTLRWKTFLGGRVFSRPAVEGQQIYIGGGTTFYAVKATDGKILWKFPVGKEIHYDSCVDETGIYFGSDDSYFYKVSKNGAELWLFQGGERFRGHCNLYQHLVYTASWDRHYYALDRNSGSLVWKYYTGEHNYYGPAVGDGKVFFASHKDIHVFDAITGKLLNNPKGRDLYLIVFDGKYLWTNERGLTKRDLKGNPIAQLKFNSVMLPFFVNDHLAIVSAAGNRLLGIPKDLKEIQWEYQAKDGFWAAGVLHDNIYYVGNHDGSVLALQLPHQ